MNGKKSRIQKLMDTEIDITSVEVDSYEERKQKLAGFLEKVDAAFIAGEIDKIGQEAQTFISSGNEHKFDELTELIEVLKELSKLKDFKDWDSEFEKLAFQRRAGRQRFDHTRVNDRTDRYGSLVPTNDTPENNLANAIDAFSGALDKLLIVLDYAESGLEIRDDAVSALIGRIKRKVQATQRKAK